MTKQSKGRPGTYANKYPSCILPVKTVASTCDTGLHVYYKTVIVRTRRIWITSCIRLRSRSSKSAKTQIGRNSQNYFHALNIRRFHSFVLQCRWIFSVTHKTPPWESNYLTFFFVHIFFPFIYTYMFCIDNFNTKLRSTE